MGVSKRPYEAEGSCTARGHGKDGDDYEYTVREVSSTLGGEAEIRMTHLHQRAGLSNGLSLSLFSLSCSSASFAILSCLNLARIALPASKSISS